MYFSALKLNFPQKYNARFIKSELDNYMYGIEYHVDNTAIIYIIENDKKVNIFFSILGRDSNCQYYEFTVTRKEITKDLLQDVIKCLVNLLSDIKDNLQDSMLNLSKEIK